MKTKKFTTKIFAINIAISFFFASIFITVIYFLGEEKINYYSALINSLVVNNSAENDAVYSKEAKRLIELPTYGKRFGTIKIETIDLSLPLYHGDNLKILHYGIGHYAGSYFPGEGGSIILPGHNNVGVFNRLDELKKGDKVVIEANYGVFTYEVDSYKVVKETELDAFPIQKEEELLIMYTCYPINRSVIGRKTERYVVYAKKIGESYE